MNRCNTGKWNIITLACSEEEACSSQKRVIDWHQHHMVSLRMPMGTDDDGRDRARRVPFLRNGTQKLDIH